MRTYGLVSMASSALIVILGHLEYWYGAQASLITGCEPMRVMQGIFFGQDEHFMIPCQASK